jgi:quercetin dioxygenase-like cupin family protein
MKIAHYTEIPAQPVETEGAKGVTIRWLISKDDGAEKFAMRLFEVAPGGQTPLHIHAFEHEVFILKGEGAVWKEGENVPLRPGTAIFVPGGEKHCFRNTGKEPFQFLCLVPV